VQWGQQQDLLHAMKRIKFKMFLSLFLFYLDMTKKQLDPSARADMLTGQLVQHFEQAYAKTLTRPRQSEGTKAAGRTSTPSFCERCLERGRVLLECVGVGSDQRRSQSLPYTLLILVDILSDAINEEYSTRSALVMRLWTGQNEKVNLFLGTRNAV